MAIGLGVIGMNPTNMGSTATLLKDVPDLKYELRGICAKRADVLENYANQIGVDFWTTDYRELVQRDDVSVVAIYSPDHLHAEHCVAAIEAGKTCHLHKTDGDQISRCPAAGGSGARA